jgi:hypothetical protein
MQLHSRHLHRQGQWLYHLQQLHQLLLHHLRNHSLPWQRWRQRQPMHVMSLSMQQLRCWLLRHILGQSQPGAPMLAIYRVLWLGQSPASKQRCAMNMGTTFAH